LKAQQEAASSSPSSHQETTLEDLFSNLDLTEFVQIFSNEGIDLAALLTCTEDDLKEANLPLGPRKKLMQYLEERKKKGEEEKEGAGYNRGGDGLNGLDEYNRSAVTSGRENSWVSC
jgi:hypothetical protein